MAARRERMLLAARSRPTRLRRAGTPSRSWWSRAPPACRTSCRSATAGWRRRRSRSTAEPPRSWRRTSRPRPITGLLAQLCGDAHLSNFGIYDTPGAPAAVRPQRLRRDVARAPASGMSSDSRPAGDRWPDLGSGPKRPRQLRLPAVAAYRSRMAELADMGNLEVWHTRLDVDDSWPVLRSARPQAGRQGARDDRKGPHATTSAPSQAHRDATTPTCAFASRPTSPRAARGPPRPGPPRYVDVIRAFLERTAHACP